MAGSSLLALLDDIAAVLDDVALMTKVAAKKTSGVLGDDLALNAQQVSGVRADRELPVVWAVAKGSFINKLILVPLALAISAFIPWAVTPLLMLGGAFLCYEGFEKLAHKYLHPKAPHNDNDPQANTPALSQEEIAAYEKQKVKGAIRTDFILSAEIIAITLGTVAHTGFLQQVLVMSGIAITMTIGVYGLVAGIVRLDDVGFYLRDKKARLAKAVGNGLVNTTPYLMRTLSVVGTAAMFMVGGGILTHGLAPISQLITNWSAATASVPAIGSLLQALSPTLLNMLFGVIAGAMVLLGVSVISKVIPKKSANKSN
ncbi:DUF808 domain-containing protein [Pragia fontium]|uniref:DUF808 domain-containing protein n=2 Tax=Pragia fontium TaxID=82985 RepID=A0AAJ4W973_9GAMM|nr:DUF808 domain-containing protein [Pragia fontium]AKJ41983.1 membrane protein [Pragia fontium]GKX61988.1 hypothetical protein SOASR032_05570 [Pragia fontium]SFC43968.1 hypothetical protein SAMN02745723_102361 [Pragia fontium DSM 5563 = ATCC 49100]VEJ54948.1 Inner membrane protein yedI [Pragia fontium]